MFGVARDTCWSLSAKGAGRGQVYMGLDYYDENNEPLCGALRETVARFERVVVDYAGKYPTGAACFKALELPATFEPVASVVLELEGNRWPDLSGSWLPTGLTARVLYVLTHRNARALAERRRRASAFSNPQVHLTPPPAAPTQRSIKSQAGSARRCMWFSCRHRKGSHISALQRGTAGVLRGRSSRGGRGGEGGGGARGDGAGRRRSRARGI